MSAQLSCCVAVYSRHFVASRINAPAVVVVFTLDHFVTSQRTMGCTKSLLDQATNAQCTRRERVRFQRGGPNRYSTAYCRPIAVIVHNNAQLVLARYTVAELINKSDQDLFYKLSYAVNHLLRWKPARNCVTFRTRGHSNQLPEYSTDKKSFLIRCLYSFVK